MYTVYDLYAMQRDDTQDQIKKETESTGFFSCCSCLWSCCSGPTPPEDVPMQPTVQQNVETKKTDPNESLLRATNNPASETKSDREESVSSTEYAGNLLPPLKPESAHKKCLVLDLDETLVHSSFKPIPKPDFIIPVEIDRVVHHVYVLKRPYVDEFLQRAAKHYEIVIFTASLAKVCHLYTLSLYTLLESSTNIIAMRFCVVFWAALLLRSPSVVCVYTASSLFNAVSHIVLEKRFNLFKIYKIWKFNRLQISLFLM